MFFYVFFSKKKLKRNMTLYTVYQLIIHTNQYLTADLDDHHGELQLENRWVEPPRKNHSNCKLHLKKSKKTKYKKHSCHALKTQVATLHT